MEHNLPDTVALLKSRGYDVDYAPGVVLAQVAAIVSDGGWLQGGSDGRSGAGKAAGYACLAVFLLWIALDYLAGGVAHGFYISGAADPELKTIRIVAD